jgi:hypothetical protein
MVWVRDVAAVDIGQACQPGYEAPRAGVLLAPETDVTVSPLNLPHVPIAAMRVFTTDPGFPLGM